MRLTARTPSFTCSRAAAVNRHRAAAVGVEMKASRYVLIMSGLRRSSIPDDLTRAMLEIFPTARRLDAARRSRLR